MAAMEWSLSWGGDKGGAATKEDYENHPAGPIKHFI
jgi:hypothetical protein